MATPITRQCAHGNRKHFLVLEFGSRKRKRSGSDGRNHQADSLRDGACALTAKRSNLKRQTNSERSVNDEQRIKSRLLA